MSKDNAEVIHNIKENTIKMYDQTIEEMKKRGASEVDIKIVESAKADAVAAYDKPANVDSNAVKYEYITKEYVDSQLGRGPIDEPSFMPSNLFIVEIGDLPSYFHKSVSFDHKKNEIYLETHESTELSPYFYFKKNKKFGKLVISYLDRTGAVVRTDTFYKVKVKNIHTDGLSYDYDGFIATYVTLKYKKHESTAS